MIDGGDEAVVVHVAEVLVLVALLDFLDVVEPEMNGLIHPKIVLPCLSRDHYFFPFEFQLHFMLTFLLLFLLLQLLFRLVRPSAKDSNSTGIVVSEQESQSSIVLRVQVKIPTCFLRHLRHSLLGSLLH